eukprot:GDKJ01018089.1.p1 GENE.GDKJ01018089.1~~GDKJ01018089.1.p1  ORF type:complete len:638 (+),score=169.58 GDKJ01018089.1:25-1938(+)
MSESRNRQNGILCSSECHVESVDEISSTDRHRLTAAVYRALTRSAPYFVWSRQEKSILVNAQPCKSFTSINEGRSRLKEFSHIPEVPQEMRMKPNLHQLTPYSDISTTIPHDSELQEIQPRRYHQNHSSSQQEASPMHQITTRRNAYRDDSSQDENVPHTSSPHRQYLNGNYPHHAHATPNASGRHQSRNNLSSNNNSNIQSGSAASHLPFNAPTTSGVPASVANVFNSNNYGINLAAYVGASAVIQNQQQNLHHAAAGNSVPAGTAGNSKGFASGNSYGNNQQQTLNTSNPPGSHSSPMNAHFHQSQTRHNAQNISLQSPSTAQATAQSSSSPQSVPPHASSGIDYWSASDLRTLRDGLVAADNIERAAHRSLMRRASSLQANNAAAAANQSTSSEKREEDVQTENNVTTRRDSQTTVASDGAHQLEHVKDEKKFGVDSNDSSSASESLPSDEPATSASSTSPASSPDLKPVAENVSSSKTSNNGNSNHIITDDNDVSNSNSNACEELFAPSASPVATVPPLPPATTSSMEISPEEDDKACHLMDTLLESVPGGGRDWKWYFISTYFYFGNRTAMGVRSKCIRLLDAVRRKGGAAAATLALHANGPLVSGNAATPVVVAAVNIALEKLEGRGAGRR